ncbi:MAG: hypothetical protein WCB94_16345 [Terriglobales bacterium]
MRDVVQVLAACILLGTLAACSGPVPPEPAQASQAIRLESIPAPDPAKYPVVRDMVHWQNPYLVVREDGIGLVDLANSEIHMLKPEEVPGRLVSLPSSAWPYGRVVLVAESVPKDPTEQTKADVRKNRALLLGTLKELDVQYRETP